MPEDSTASGSQPPEGTEQQQQTQDKTADTNDFTPEQKRKLGRLLSAERKAVRDQVAEQYRDYPDLKRKLQEIEASKLSVEERLQKERDAAITEAAQFKNQAEALAAKELRLSLFADYKTKDGQSLPIHLMKYVTGNDKSEIAASIESIADDFGAKQTRKSIGSPTPPGSEAVEGKHGFMNAQILAGAGRGGR